MPQYAAVAMNTFIDGTKERFCTFGGFVAVDVSFADILLPAAAHTETVASLVNWVVPSSSTWLLGSTMVIPLC